LSAAFAERVGAGLVAAGLLLCAAQGAPVLAVGAFDAVLVWVYARRSKSLGWLKTVCVCVLQSSVVLFVGAVLRRFDALLALLALYVFASTAFRELVKDRQDAPGDGACGARTPVLLHGRRLVDAVALASLAVSVGTVVPGYLWGLGNGWLLVLVPASACAYYGASRLEGRSYRRWMRLGWVLEALALLVGFR
jgi:4-hydroxybenzoate polyprenyltransferase